jgi:hypothetical protein
MEALRCHDACPDQRSRKPCALPGRIQGCSPVACLMLAALLLPMHVPSECNNQMAPTGVCPMARAHRSRHPHGSNVSVPAEAREAWLYSAKKSAWRAATHHTLWGARHLWTCSFISFGSCSGDARWSEGGWPGMGGRSPIRSMRICIRGAGVGKAGRAAHMHYGPDGRADPGLMQGRHLQLGLHSYRPGKQLHRTSMLIESASTQAFFTAFALPL